MLNRLILLQVLIAGGLSLVFLLPKSPPLQPSAVSLELPNVMILSGWTAGPKIDPSERELLVLAKDTNFARRVYRRNAGMDAPAGAREELQASIVLSGKDLNNSVHRPERCLPAQGLNLVSSTEIPVKLKGGQQITLTRLLCTGNHPGTQTTYTHLNYYWFVGHDSVKNTHYGRTLKDMRDRLMEGYDQRWAYITISSNLVSIPLRDEDGQEYFTARLSEEETDRNVAEFVSELAPEIIDLKAVKSWQ
ncbi:MAG: exosortase-associated EpsI family protein [Verrucomicrobiota bacterium]